MVTYPDLTLDLRPRGARNEVVTSAPTSRLRLQRLTSDKPQPALHKDSGPLGGLESRCDHALLALATRRWRSSRSQRRHARRVLLAGPRSAAPRRHRRLDERGVPLADFRPYLVEWLAQIPRVLAADWDVASL